MKLKTNHILLFAATLLLAACSEDFNPWGDGELTPSTVFCAVTPDQLEYPAEGGTSEFRVASKAGMASSLSYPGTAKDWVEMTESASTDGEGVVSTVITLKAGATPSCNPRECVLTLTPDLTGAVGVAEQGVKFTLVQKGRALSAVSEIVMIAAAGTSAVYTVTADGKVSIEKNTADDWYTVDVGSDGYTFFVTATKNDTKRDRVGEVLIRLLELPSGESKEHKVTVTQKRTSLIDITPYPDTDENYNPGA